MGDTAIVATHNYDSIIHRQQKRIRELEADLARYSDKIRLLKTRATENHHSAIVAAAASDYARIHAAHVHAVLAMSAATPSVLPTSSSGAGGSPPGVSGVRASTSACNRPAATACKPSVLDDTDERAGKTRYWTEMEHNHFLYAVKLFGAKNYVAISQFVGTRTPKQVRTHAQKYQMKLQREAKKRRAQAAAVVAVTAPGAAAAAAAAAAMCGGGDTSLPLAGLAGLQAMPFVPVPLVPGMDAFADGVKSKCHAARSTSTCPMADEDASTNERVDDDELAAIAYSSPVSNDEDVELGDADVADGLVDGLLQHTPPGGVFKKTPSLNNLADYDDFMRRITNAVQDPRHPSDHVFDDDGNDLDMHLLDASKKEQFDDSLLVDL